MRRRVFISDRDMERSACAQSRRALTGHRLAAHINRVIRVERAERQAHRDNFARFQLQERTP